MDKKDKNEHFPKSVAVGSKDTIGCLRWKMDVNISFKDEIENEFHDIFLTDKQTQELIIKLMKNVKDPKQVLREIKLNSIL